NSSGPLVFHRRSGPVVSLGVSVESEFGCRSQEFRADLKRRPVFELSMDNTAGCPPLEVHAAVTPLDLTDQVTYNWMLGSDQSGTGSDFRPLLRLPDQRYALRVVAASSTTGCADTMLVPDAVQVFPVPRAAFIAKPPVALISNPLVAFENKSENAQHYTWDFNDQTGLLTDVSPSHRFKEMGLFRVLLTAVNDWGCSDTTSREVVVAFDRLFPPTAFSPNSPKAEDREFRLNSTGIKAEGFQLLVFNRWGEVVFESSTPETGWDGRMKNGNFAPPGVYTWVVTYLDFRDKKHRQQGTVTLLF
ncbi:MAG TPA: gliding motility-associated C-terminal domain-containing protein, partial [Prolixibacteraceae bacterium]|nr:gliding motility-associated C-terminal domain-containing protein [Prolixibacteraceae bacterium]